MKILAFVDIHEDKRSMQSILSKSRHADVLISAGDMTIYGDNLHTMLRQLDEIGKPVLIIHGNAPHESATDIITAISSFNNIKLIHKVYHIIDDIIFFGYGGGGFSIEDPKFDIVMEIFMKEKVALEKKHNKKLRLVLITHAPPHGTKLDDLGYSVGNKSITRFVKKHRPALLIAGHIHENSGQIDFIDGIQVINPGPDGAIIEL